MGKDPSTLIQTMWCTWARFRMRVISGRTQLLGLIGDPVAHSLSPVMHNAALAALELDYVYLPFPVKPDQLGAAISGLAAIGVQGFNVTIPHKQTIIPFLKTISPQAKAIGAVNTVYREDPECADWSGSNTDLAGFLAPLRSALEKCSAQASEDFSKELLESLEPKDQQDQQDRQDRQHQQHPTHRRVTILGSGGAARAVIEGCQQLGLTPIGVVGRSEAKLADLQHTWPTIEPYAWSELSDLLPQTCLLVNTTPIGMHTTQTDQATPLTPDQIACLPTHSIVYDLIYTPNPTLLLKLAADRGCITIDGLDMLIEQGAAALSLWLGGRSVPVEIMRRAARQHLGLE